MPQKVLHILSQRPGLTGSGTTLNALVRQAALAGWDQRVIIGVPTDADSPSVGDLPAAHTFPLRFGPSDSGGAVPFALPGMSDVMPYPSSRFSALTPDQLESYRTAWRAHVGDVVARFAPDVIHSHHIWLMSSILRDVAPNIPIVTHCHATGLRQMQLTPSLRDEVQRGCARNDHFVVLHKGHRRALTDALGIAPERITVVGAGFDEELFHARGRVAATPAILYAGKLSRAKGLPWLLEVFDIIAPRMPSVQLHVAGGGAGDEATQLREQMASLAPRVVYHGQLAPPDLAELMRQCSLFVLPSFYEGLPLVLVEAVACGCRALSTRLPGIVEGLAGHLGGSLTLVDPPRLRDVDQPVPEDLPAFVERLLPILEKAIARPLPKDAAKRVEPFRWSTIFARVQGVWNDQIAATQN